MPDLAAPKHKLSPVFLVVGGVLVVILILGGAWLNQTRSQTPASGPSSEATAYLPSLRLSDVTMKAADNLMHQQVVYVDGKISNNGTRSINRIDVFCIFAGVDGHEIYRERASIVQSVSGHTFQPQQTRSFELPFDSVPENWNQAMPRLVIAQIRFAQ